MCKKLLVILLIVTTAAMIATVGCTKEQNEQPAAATGTEAQQTGGQSTAQQETPTVRMTVVDTGQQKWKDPEMNYIKLLSQAGNMKINPIPVPSERYADKLSTFIVSGDLPDIMFLREFYYQYREYAPFGLWVKLDDYWDKMPNVKSKVLKYPEFDKLMKVSDGSIYGVPAVEEEPAASSGPMINIEPLVAKGIDYQKIETLDDFYNALKVLKAYLGGKAFPWISRAKEKFVSQVTPLFGTSQSLYVNPEDDKFHFGPLDENFKVMMEFLAKCWQEKIIDPNVLTFDEVKWGEMLMSDFGFFTIDAQYQGWWRVKTPPEDQPDANKDYKWNIDHMMRPLLPFSVNGKKYFSTEQGYNIDTKSIRVISAKTKALDNILKMLDFAYGDEGLTKLTWGTEGETYVVKDGKKYILQSKEKGWPYVGKNNISFSEQGLYMYGDPFIKTQEMYMRFWNAILDTSGNIEFPLPMLENYQKEVYDMNKQAGAFRKSAPELLFSDDEYMIVKNTQISIETYVSENIFKFLKGEKPMSEFDGFVAKIKEMKVDDLLKVYNDAYDRMKK